MITHPPYSVNLRWELADAMAGLEKVTASTSMSVHGKSSVMALR